MGIIATPMLPGTALWIHKLPEYSLLRYANNKYKTEERSKALMQDDQNRQNCNNRNKENDKNRNRNKDNQNQDRNRNRQNER